MFTAYTSHWMQSSLRCKRVEGAIDGSDAGNTGGAGQEAVHAAPLVRLRGLEVPSLLFPSDGWPPRSLGAEARGLGNDEAHGAGSEVGQRAPGDPGLLRGRAELRHPGHERLGLSR